MFDRVGEVTNGHFQRVQTGARAGQDGHDAPMREGVSLREAVFHYATTYALLGLFYANGFNLMRAVYKDVSAGRDWFRPLILLFALRAQGACEQ